MDKKYGVFSSSVDPQKLSLTIKGVIAAVVPIILVLAPMFHWSVNADDFNHLADGVEAVIVAGSSLVSAVMIVYGLIRKFRNSF